jgi:hypothetical protein
MSVFLLYVSVRRVTNLHHDAYSSYFIYDIVQ